MHIYMYYSGRWDKKTNKHFYGIDILVSAHEKDSFPRYCFNLIRKPNDDVTIDKLRKELETGIRGFTEVYGCNFSNMKIKETDMKHLFQHLCYINWFYSFRYDVELEIDDAQSTTITG